MYICIAYIATYIKYTLIIFFRPFILFHQPSTPQPNSFLFPTSFSPTFMPFQFFGDLLDSIRTAGMGTDGVHLLDKSNLPAATPLRNTTPPPHTNHQLSTNSSGRGGSS